MVFKKKDFPLFSEHPELVYADNAATSQKPAQVIERMQKFYAYENAPVHRGIYQLSEQATHVYEQLRIQVAQFINAAYTEEIVFTAGATDALNFVAATWGYEHIKKGDEIVLTELEHHAQILPWLEVARRTGATLKYIPVLPDGTLDLSQLDTIITQRTKFVGMVHVSNAIGTHVDVAPIITRARQVGARVLLDACQSAPHQKIDVQKLDCDFVAFSGHKLLGPTGVGVLYIKKLLHDEIQPYRRGGGAVYDADFYSVSWLPAPQKFEAGTPPIAQVIGLGAALEYLQTLVNFDALRAHEAALCTQLIDGLSTMPGIRIFGPIEQLKKHGHLVTFALEGIHSHDVAAFLDQHNIAVRAGDFCTRPLMKKLGIPSAVRASFYLYNTLDDVAKILAALRELIKG